MRILDLVGDFTWDFGQRFHIHTKVGDFEWRDPDYGGDNSIRPCAPYQQWIKKSGAPFGRSKGSHVIREYCGDEVKIIV